MNALEKLRSVVDDLKSPAEPLKILDQWGLAGRLLSRFPVDPARAAAAVRDKDLAGLDAIVTELESPQPKPATATAPAAPADYPEAHLAAAMRAFRKRLKLMRLSDESKLGGRYTSGGKQSKIDAIQPPSEFEDGVWKALAAQGKLEHTGQGFYREP